MTQPRTRRDACALPRGWMTLPLLLSLLAGCLPPSIAKERRELRQRAEAEAAAAESALEAVPVDAARLEIAQLQDARQGHERLVELSRHPDPSVRAAAARALARVGEDAAGDVLILLLEDRSPRVAAAAAYGLGQLEWFRSTDLERTTLRVEATDALRIRLDDCRRTLRFDEGREAEVEVCRVVVRSLGAIGGEVAHDLLWDTMAKGVASPTLRRAVPLALAVQAKDGRGQPITAEQITWLAPRLIDATDPAQWAAAYLLARAELTDAAREPTSKLLQLGWSQATSETARVWLLRAMAKLGDDPATATIAQALADPEASQRVRVAAIRSSEDRTGLLSLVEQDLTRGEQRELWSRLAGLEAKAEAEDAEVRAVLAAPIAEGDAFLVPTLAPLVTTGWQVEPLLEWLGSGEPARVEAAAAALAAAPGVDEALVQALEAATERTTRIAVAAALVEREGEVVEAALMTLALDDDPILGALAATGLADREGEHVTARLREAWDAADGPGEWERRLALTEALVPREDAKPDDVKRAMLDEDALVREAGTRLMRERFDRATSGPPARPRPVAKLPDPLFGVGDVRGATVVTDVGSLELSLRPDLAPGTVANFVSLAADDVYDGLPFHRVVEDFVVQTGDPLGNGWGGPGYTIRCETTAEPYRRGTVGMALSGRDTGGSQWFVTLSPQPHLDGRYTVFGQVTDGWDVLDAIEEGAVVEDVIIHRGE